MKTSQCEKYWIDENNNTWSKSRHTEHQAKIYSGSLVNCSDCSNCSYCSNCSDWQDNPQRIVSNKIGSRNSNTTIYFNSEKTQVVCGCYSDTLENFEKRVIEVHTGTRYIHEYINWIERVKVYMGIK